LTSSNSRLPGRLYCLALNGSGCRCSPSNPSRRSRHSSQMPSQFFQRDSIPAGSKLPPKWHQTPTRPLRLSTALQKDSGKDMTCFCGRLTMQAKSSPLLQSVGNCVSLSPAMIPESVNQRNKVFVPSVSIPHADELVACSSRSHEVGWKLAAMAFSAEA